MSYRRTRRLERRATQKKPPEVKQLPVLIRREPVSDPGIIVDDDELRHGENEDRERQADEAYDYLQARLRELGWSRTIPMTPDGFFDTKLGRDLLEAVQGNRKMALVLKAAYEYAYAQQTVGRGSPRKADHDAANKERQPVIQPFIPTDYEQTEKDYLCLTGNFKKYCDLAYYQVGRNASHDFFIAYDPGSDKFIRCSVVYEPDRKTEISFTSYAEISGRNGMEYLGHY